MAQGCLLLRSTPWSSEIPISDAMVMVYDFFTRSLMPLFRVTNSGLTSPDPLTTSIDKWRFCSIGIKQIKPDVIALWHGWQCRNHWVCSRPDICPFFDTDIFFLKERKKEGKHNHKRKRTVTNIKFGLIARCNSIAVPNTSPASLGIGFDNRGV